jgi:hypothetical protein
MKPDRKLLIATFDDLISKEELMKKIRVTVSKAYENFVRKEHLIVIQLRGTRRCIVRRK